MMRVLMTTDAVGGVWTYCLELCRALDDLGVAVDLASMGPAPARDQQEDARSIANLELHVSEFSLEWMPGAMDDVRRAGDWLLQLQRTCAPDVVHLNGYVHAALPWSRPVLVVAHSCVASWWAAVKQQQLPRDWNEYVEGVRAGLRAASLVIAPTQAMLEALHEQYGSLPAARVIPNGRDAAVFQPSAKAPFVLSAGRFWDEAKNLRTLDRAAADIHWPVRVAGEAECPAGGEVAATPLNVLTLGKRSPSHLAQQMSAASIYALPALYEPFGLSILEAALSGCALVLGNIPSLREVWKDSAVFVPPRDSDALADAINALIADEKMRGDYSTRAKTRAEIFSPGRMGASYLDAYRSLIYQHDLVIH